MTAEMHPNSHGPVGPVRPWWGLALAALAVAALVLLVRPQPTWDAAEVDGLAAGTQLADALTAGADGLGKRTQRGFGAVPGHPLCAASPDSLSCSEAATDSPLLRWFVAGSVLSMPAGDDASSAGLGAALAFALAAFLAGLLLAHHLNLGAPAVVLGAALVVLMPGALASASTAGAAALGALVTALVLLGIQRVVRGGGALLASAAIGLALALHPVGITLLVPLFICAAIARPPHTTPGHTTPAHSIPAHSSSGHAALARAASAPAAGLLPLPPVALTLFAAPLVAVLIFVLLWPAAWHETTKHLGGWLQSGLTARAPAQTIVGVAFEQASGRAPGAVLAFLQWVAWTPTPLLAAWVLGVAVTARAGRSGLWAPLLVLATVLVSAGLDAGLFGARRNLLAWLWVPTALTASVGVVALGDWVARQRPRLPRGAVWALICAAVMLTPALALILGVAPTGAALVGTSIRAPLPAYVPTFLTDSSSGAAAPAETGVHVVASNDGYAYALQVLSERGSRAFHWVPTVEGADWVFVVHEHPDVVVEALAGRAPRDTVYAGGLRVDVYGPP